jgi:hypothetical protein
MQAQAVVVRAGVDAVDALRPASARGQDQHRRAAVVRAPALEHGQPVHSRQAEVEDDRAIVLGVAAEPGFLAVAHDLDDVAGGLERARDVRRKRRSSSATGTHHFFPD